MTTRNRIPVWEVVASLSGVPFPERNERPIMAVQFYIDESGKGGDGPVFVLACLEAPAESWVALSDEWRAVLHDEPAIEYFSMAECWAARGQFEGWDRLDAWKKGERLAHIAEKYVARVHSFFVDHATFRAIFEKKVDRRYDDPYYFMATDAIEEILARHLKEGDHSETLEFIFDRQPAFELDIHKWYEAMSTGSVRDFPHARFKKLVPNRPSFADEKDSVPLQAADMVAWNCRRIWANVSHGKEHKWFFPIAHSIEAIPTLHIRTEEDWLKAEYRRLMDALPEGSGYYYGAVKVRDSKDRVQSLKNRDILARASDSKSFVSLETISTKRTKRYLLKSTCPNDGSPHLHSRSSDRCLSLGPAKWSHPRS